MKNIIFIFIILHGAIHLLGFAKSFNLLSIPSLHKGISKVNGVFWLISGLLFWIGGIVLYHHNEYWWIFLVVAIVISQYLVFTDWHDARLGTLVNLVFMILVMIGYATWNFKQHYRKKSLHSVEFYNGSMPSPVQV